MRSVMALALALTLGACTTSNGFINYQDQHVYASETAGNFKFKDVGPVTGSARSFAWATCDTLAANALREMIDLAKTRGASTVYKITFEGSDGRVTTPTCFTGWGWFALYGVGGLGPWVTSTHVEGIAANLDGDAKATGSIDIRSSDSQAIAADYVARLRLARAD